ncbi:DUF6286 domain-containing protein [Synoicihabitans lomoniglobus]|uniref:DUF6286 domain-containing protein n=1 Tax=Synoicihabitans lomoniglobus TaxID=2909285 RepID=A0AAE9ZWB0_9BACT|nr:alkaline shock response membrane anchor protein AmaP [Opitutaceae bacterium LMO-M01]WED65431.1 DUF6286 domain-containing protein [Opitutaceae bacterium LMO-M01]
MSPLTDYLLSSPFLVIGLGGGLALLLVLLFLRQPRALPLASNESGELLISRRALHRMVEACCEQVKGVASANASIKIRKSQFTTRLRLKVRPEAKLDAIQGYLTQEITEIYRENLGLTSEIGPIEIKIVGVIPAEPGF